MRSLSTLVKSQQVFAEALITPDLEAPRDVVRPAKIAQQKQLKRFNIYRNNVIATVIDALSDTFPVVRAQVGDEFFAATARAFLDKCPMQSPLLFRYGETFGEFLDEFPPVQNSVPYLGDIARLEYARLQAYHAADATPLDISALGAVPEEALASVTLEAHPSVALVRSRFPIVSIWGASSGHLDHTDVNMMHGEDALIVRPKFSVDTVALPEGGAAFLSTLISGGTLGEAAEAGATETEDFDLSAHLAGLFSAGAFVQIFTTP